MGPVTYPGFVYEKDIFDDIVANDTESVKRRVEVDGFPLTQRNKKNETVAHVAAQEKNLIMLKYFLIKSPDLINIKDQSENSVLTVAIDQGAMDLIRYLVDELGANVYDRHKLRFGNTAIHNAAEGDQVEVMKYLIDEKKVDVNILNWLQESPIFLTTENSRMNALKYLVEQTKANVTALDSNLDNILYATAMNGNVEMARYILDERKINFDIDYRDRFGRTLVYIAARFNHMPYVKYCVEEKHANIDLANNRGWTPLFEVSFQGHADMMKYLLSKGSDPNRTDVGEQTLEMVADLSIRKVLNETLGGRLPSRKRLPRSASDSYFWTYDESESAPTRSKIIGTNVWALSSGDGRPTSPAFSSEILISKLVDSFLTIANFFIGNTRDTLFGRRHEALLSPGEIIDAHTDQQAAEAVEQLPRIFDYDNFH